MKNNWSDVFNAPKQPKRPSADEERNEINQSDPFATFASKSKTQRQNESNNSDYNLDNDSAYVDEKGDNFLSTILKSIENRVNNFSKIFSHK